jgi:hypothetical protein
MRMRGFLAILILALVIVYLLFIVKIGKKSKIEKEAQVIIQIPLKMTEANMAALEKVIEFFIASEGRTPRDLKELQSKRIVIGGTTDAWGRLIKYERLSDINFRLVSAGKDGVFNTEDDIVLND